MIEYFKYPSLKFIVIQELPAILTNLGLSNFRVGSKKLRDSSNAPAVEIIIQEQGGPTENKILYEGFSIFIWVTLSNENEAEVVADEVTETVTNALSILPHISGVQLKGFQDLSSSSVENEGITQVRNITGEALLIPVRLTY